METTTIEIEMELQVEENVALATRLSTLVGNEGKKKKKRFGQKLLGEVKEHIPKDARVEKKKKALKSKKRKRENVVATLSPQVPCARKLKARKKWLKRHPRRPRAKKRLLRNYPLRPRAKKR